MVRPWTRLLYNVLVVTWLIDMEIHCNLHDIYSSITDVYIFEHGHL